MMMPGRKGTHSREYIRRIEETEEQATGLKKINDTMERMSRQKESA